MENNQNPFSDEAKHFANLVETRRSIRLFDKTPIPPEIVQHCLDLALLAPNSSNLQPWEFYWVRTPDTKAKLVEACMSQAAAATASELIVCVARTSTWRRACEDMKTAMEKHKAAGGRVPKAATLYYEKLVPIMYMQGIFSLFGYLKKIAFFFIGLRKPIGREPTSLNDMKIWATKSTALACENLMLAFRAHGFDTCPMEGMDSSRVKRLLNLPGDALVPMVIAAGKRRPEGVTLPRIRGDRSLYVKEV